jgi:pyridoxine 5-phosphate synthase
VVGNFERIRAACESLGEAGIEVSLFIDAEPQQIEAAAKAGAPAIELHTGHYADAANPEALANELKRLRLAAEQADALGLKVNAGHGLNYHNVEPICRLPQIRELNIGHAIIARALFTGLERAVADLKAIMRAARLGN